MKQKWRKLLTLIGVIPLLWGVIFLTDLSRCANLKAPLFAFPLGVTADDGGSGIYYGLGYTVHVEKYLDADYGTCIRAVEMRMLSHVIAASIT